MIFKKIFSTIFWSDLSSQRIFHNFNERQINRETKISDWILDSKFHKSFCLQMRCWPDAFFSPGEFWKTGNTSGFRVEENQNPTERKSEGNKIRRIRRIFIRSFGWQHLLSLLAPHVPFGVRPLFIFSPLRLYKSSSLHFYSSYLVFSLLRFSCLFHFEVPDPHPDMIRSDPIEFIQLKLQLRTSLWSIKFPYRNYKKLRKSYETVSKTK